MGNNRSLGLIFDLLWRPCTVEGRRFLVTMDDKGPFRTAVNNVVQKLFCADAMTLPKMTLSLKLFPSTIAIDFYRQVSNICYLLPWGTSKPGPFIHEREDEEMLIRGPFSKKLFISGTPK